MGKFYRNTDKRTQNIKLDGTPRAVRSSEIIVIAPEILLQSHIVEQSFALVIFNTYLRQNLQQDFKFNP